MVWGKTIAHASIQYARVDRAVEADEGAFFVCVVLALLLTWSTTTLADDVAKDEAILFDIPRQRADRALTRFAEQADLNLIFPFEEVREKTANRLVGPYPKEEAVEVLLAGTGLQPKFSDEAILIITPYIKRSQEAEK